VLLGIKAITLCFLSGAAGLVLMCLSVELEERFGLDFLFRVRGVRPAPHDVLIVSMDRMCRPGN